MSVSRSSGWRLLPTTSAADRTSSSSTTLASSSRCRTEPTLSTCQPCRTANRAPTSVRNESGRRDRGGSRTHCGVVDVCHRVLDEIHWPNPSLEPSTHSLLTGTWIRNLLKTISLALSWYKVVLLRSLIVDTWGVAGLLPNQTTILIDGFSLMYPFYTAKELSTTATHDRNHRGRRDLDEYAVLSSILQ